MNDTLKVSFAGGVLAATTTLATAGAFGIGLGSIDAVYTSTHQAIQGENRYEIHGPDDGFYFETNAGRWEKLLLAPEDGFQPGEIYCVSEQFTFYPRPDGSAGFPLEGWTQAITYGPHGDPWGAWVTDPATPVISFDPDSLEPIPGLEFFIQGLDNDLLFFFDPIDVGSDGVTFYIEQYFRFSGPTVSFDPLPIQQFPIPTPSSLAMLAIGGLVTSSRRRV